jgi:hypothetical protein
MRVTTTILLIITTITLALGVLVVRLYGENRRLRSNNYALSEQLVLYRTAADESAASVGVLQLRLDEFRRQHNDDCRTIRELGIRLRRAESYAKTAMRGSYSSTLLLRDTIIEHDTIRLFATADEWSELRGELRGDTLSYALHTVDTLHQVVHRIPRRFLFFRFGTKGLRQEIVSSNPHTTLVYSEYIDIVK